MDDSEEKRDYGYKADVLFFCVFSGGEKMEKRGYQNGYGYQKFHEVNSDFDEIIHWKEQRQGMAHGEKGD